MHDEATCQKESVSRQYFVRIVDFFDFPPKICKIHTKLHPMNGVELPRPWECLDWIYTVWPRYWTDLLVKWMEICLWYSFEKFVNFRSLIFKHQNMYQECTESGIFLNNMIINKLKIDIIEEMLLGWSSMFVIGSTFETHCVTMK